MADLLRVAIMHRVTDTYGPFPIRMVVEDKKESLSVGYDTQKEVYMKMFEELDAAIAVLKANASLSTEAFGKFDGVYGGNVGKWVKFANSLKLRLAMLPFERGAGDRQGEGRRGHRERRHREQRGQRRADAGRESFGALLDQLERPPHRCPT